MKSSHIPQRQIKTTNDILKASFPQFLRDFGNAYHRETNTVFELGICENCGGIVQEVNAVKLYNIPAPIMDRLLFVDDLPPEVTIIDGDTGECGCEACA